MSLGRIGTWRVSLCVMAGFALCAVARADTASVSPPNENSRPKAVVISLNGEVDDWRRDAMERRFAEARRLGATVVILKVDTYGGLVTSGLDISRFIKRQTDLHTIAFVHDKAISAGAMIAMACNEIVMEPGSVIGDCAPISISSEGRLQSLPAAERAKLESPVLADFRDSASRNGYDPLLAEAMVAVDRTVHVFTDSSGSIHFLDNEHLGDAKANDWKQLAAVRDPLDTAHELLTLPAEIATTIGLSRGVFANENDFARQRGLSIVESLSPGAGDAIIEALASPIARWIYIVAFVLSIKTAFSIPGHGMPEAIALTSFGLLVGMPFLTGYAQWWEIAMIVGGLCMLAFEVFVLPGHFVSGAVGVLMMVIGLTLTFVGREPSGPGVLPNYGQTYLALQTGLTVVTAALIASLLLWFWLGRFLPKLPYFKRLVLQPVGGDGTMIGALGAEVVWPLVGSIGRAATELKPGGSAMFDDDTINGPRIVSVVSDAGFVTPGSNVVVTESRGSRVVVRLV